MNEHEEVAGAGHPDDRGNQTPHGSTPFQIPSSAWQLPPALARALAYEALRLYEALESEPWTAGYGLEWTIRQFQEQVAAEVANAAELRSGDVVHANARLIAAAPELLEAAKDFLFWHDEDPLGSGYTSRDVHLHGLRAAITKATGEP